MCYGDPRIDHFALNDDRVWSGSPASEFAEGRVSAEGARFALSKARRLLGEADYRGADHAVRQIQQSYSQAYLPIGSLDIEWLNAPTAVSSHRELDLRSAIHRLAASGMTREAFISAPASVLAVRSVFDCPASIEVRLVTELGVVLERTELDGSEMVVRLPSDVAPTHEVAEGGVTYSGVPTMSMTAAMLVRVEHDGKARRVAGGLRIDGLTELLVVLTTATSFRALGEPPDADLEVEANAARHRLASATAQGWEELVRVHRADHGQLYERVEVQFGREATGTEPPSRSGMGDQSHAVDPGLASLLFNYGRYLLIASSRRGTLPANLQGIWNDQLRPPWSSNYTLNINTQMNYWAAESTDLPECHEPLFDLVQVLARQGTEVARRLYDAPGWAAHHNSDAWGYVSPVGSGRGNPSWAFWPMAGPWLVRHIMEHFDHGASKEFVEHQWSVSRGAVEFALSRLEEIKPGVYGVALSTSPENEFRTPSGAAAVARASTMDLELLADSSRALIRMAELIGKTDDPVVWDARTAIGRIAGAPPGRDGATREWLDDHVAVDPHHRHLSMLYGLYPGDRPFTAAERRAASRALDARGDESSGWSLIWKMCLRARLGQASKVDDLLGLLFRDATIPKGEWSGGLYPNLFAAHPPFQIDANLGYPAAIVECLVQSHRGTIELLPALPPSLDEGSARGLIVRPGGQLDIEWSGGALQHATLTARRSFDTTMSWAGVSVPITLSPGHSRTLSAADFTAWEES